MYKRTKKCQQSPHSYPLSRKGSCEGHSSHTQYPGCSSCGLSAQADPALSAPLAPALYESCLATPELRARSYNKRGLASHVGLLPVSVPDAWHVHGSGSPVYPVAQDTLHVSCVAVFSQARVSYGSSVGAPFFLHGSAGTMACASHKRSTTRTDACWGWLTNCRNKQAKPKV